MVSAPRTLALLALWASVTAAQAQRDIEPTLVFNDTSSFHFSGEWQYLSTDIYLLNGERFSSLINELEFVRLGRERRRRPFRPRSRMAEEQLEHLFITARLKNVQFLGNDDITYPLFNFQITRDRNERYHTYVSDNIDRIRIIDNLPLYSASDFIDAEIQVRAITRSDRDQVLGLIGAQLKRLATLQHPTQALMGIIGEFGNFIESNTKRREYRFSSTIRLFDQKNFDSRLHSIRVYVLLTPNSQPHHINTLPLKALLEPGASVEVNRATLTGLLDFRHYPLIVVANYKSLYRMDRISGDEVSLSRIDSRRLRIENDFRAGLINAETYRLEMDFISFLTIFANLKNHIEVYSLNHRTGNIDAASGTLFNILLHYRQLLRAHQEMLTKYRGNSTFHTVFAAEYLSVLEFANLYLDEDFNLRSLKALVHTLAELERDPNITCAATLERLVQSLRFADAIKHPGMAQSVEGRAIAMHLGRMEGHLLRAKYQPAIEALRATRATSSTRHATDSLRAMVRSTACVPCRQAGSEAIGQFNDRVQEYKRQLALAARDSVVRALQPWIFSRMQLMELAENNLSHIFAGGSPNQTRQFIELKLQEAHRDLQNLQHFSRIDVSGKEIHLIEGLIHRIGSTQAQAQASLSLVCQLMPSLCAPPQVSPPPPPGQPQASTRTADPVEEVHLLLSIFDYRLAKARKMLGLQGGVGEPQLALLAQTEALCLEMRTLSAANPNSPRIREIARQIADNLDQLLAQGSPAN